MLIKLLQVRDPVLQYFFPSRVSLHDEFCSERKRETVAFRFRRSPLIGQHRLKIENWRRIMNSCKRLVQMKTTVHCTYTNTRILGFLGLLSLPTCTASIPRICSFAKHGQSAAVSNSFAPVRRFSRSPKDPRARYFF